MHDNNLTAEMFFPRMRASLRGISSTYQANPSDAVGSWKVRLINFFQDLHFDPRSRDLVSLAAFDQTRDNPVGMTKIDLVEEGDLIS